MMVIKRNYGALTAAAGAFLAAIIIPAAIAILLLAAGIPVVVQIWRVIFSPITSGTIPVWVVFVLGIIVVYLFRRR